MCGIVAVVGRPGSDFVSPIEAMNDALAHRGPDDAGSILMRDEGVALAMRRLAVVDLDAGQQPMWDEQQQHCVVFNGEIYNHQGLREELLALGHRFTTDHSDTEVLVHGFEQWGVGLLDRIDGMFAFAIWSRERQALFVARDRAGEKPLHIARVASGHLVASELKALQKHPEFVPELDLRALDQYLAYNYVLGPRTMFQGVSKLPAGHYAWITPDRVETHRYWSFEFSDEPISEPDAIRRFDELLDESVAQRMVADVPVGLFLSGGLDSTAIGYYMRRHTDEAHSFSIAFEDAEFDESEYSTLAARHLGIKHSIQRFSSDELMDLVPQMAELLDEPLGDPSFFPTYALSKHARQHVTVALGGDGSDEFGMGYGRWRGLSLMGAFDAVPKRLRATSGRLAQRLAQGDSLLARSARMAATHAVLEPEERVLTLIAPHAPMHREMLRSDIRDQLPPLSYDRAEDLSGSFSGKRTAFRRVMGTYATSFLTEDILVKSDRATMAASLELRSPFLSAGLLDFYGNVPMSLIRSGGTGKVLLRRVMRGRIPDEIIDRSKRGFDIPLGPWLRGPLAPFVDEYLSPERLRQRQSPLDPTTVDQLVQRQRQADSQRDRLLFLLLQFELWRERWLR